MEKSPARSKPRHNFPQSFLSWGKDHHTNNIRFRRSDHFPFSRRRPPPSTPPPPQKHDHKLRCGSDAYGGCKNVTELGVVVGEKVKTETESREVIRRFSSFVSCSVVDNHRKEEVNVAISTDGVASAAQKQWNLRPRRGVKIGGYDDDFKIVESRVNDCVVQQNEETNLAKSTRLRRNVDAENVQKKARVWISLSKEEIEEDIFVMTGLKPSRKPKKWPKTVQNNLDNYFPGLSFVGLSADDYQRPDATIKK